MSDSPGLRSRCLDGCCECQPGGTEYVVSVMSPPFALHQSTVRNRHSIPPLLSAINAPCLNASLYTTAAMFQCSAPVNRNSFQLSVSSNSLCLLSSPSSYPSEKTPLQPKFFSDRLYKTTTSLLPLLTTPEHCLEEAPITVEVLESLSACSSKGRAQIHSRPRKSTSAIFASNILDSVDRQS